MMFVAEKSKISHIDMTAGARLETVITLPDDSYVNAVDGDAANEMIYYTDLRYSRIMKVNYNGSQNMPVSNVVSLKHGFGGFPCNLILPSTMLITPCGFSLSCAVKDENRQEISFSNVAQFYQIHGTKY